MSGLTFQQKLLLQNRYGVVLCHSATQSGEAFYHFIKADSKNTDKLLKAQGSGGIVDFTAYGEIVLSGWGSEPSAADIAWIKAMFPEDKT